MIANMTLIAAAINKKNAYVATDTQLTNMMTGIPVENNACKSLRIDTLDGSVLVCFSGIAYIDSINTSEWLTIKATDFKAPEHSLLELLNNYKTELFKAMEPFFSGYSSSHAGLIITFTGWVGRERTPVMRVLSNCDDESAQLLRPSPTFNTYNVELQPNGTQLTFRGALSATHSDEFIKQKAYVMQLLKRGKTVEPKTIRKRLSEMIITASNDSAGASIGNKVMASSLTRGLGGLAYDYIPDSPNWIAPSIVGKTMSTYGLAVKGDPIEGGSTRIGGNHQVR